MGASQKRLLKANSKLKVAQNILHRRNVNWNLGDMSTPEWL